MKKRIFDLNLTKMAQKSYDRFNCKPRGIFSLKVFEEGKLVDHYTDNNLVVNDAQSIMAHAIASVISGDSTYQVKSIALGQGHHVVGDILTPTTPVQTETALEDEQFRRTIQAVSFPSEGDRVTFEATIEQAEANGSGSTYYTEAGLFSDNPPDLMFAIKSFPAMVKNNLREFFFEWTIVF